MKKIAIFGLVLLFTLLNVINISAAAQKEDSGSKKFVIANVPKSVGGAWFNRMKVGIDQFAKDTGHDAFQQGADRGDAALQVREIENLIEQGVDILTVVPVSPEALEPVLLRAKQRGIVVISHEAQGIKNVDYDVEAFDGAAYGALMMDNMAERMGRSGDYVIVVGQLTAASHMQWANGALAHQKATYPNMKCLNENAFYESNYNQRAAQEQASEIMKANPNLKGIYVTSATDLPGYALAVEDANRKGQVFLIGNGVPNVNKAYLESGALAFLSCWDPADAGYAMAKVGEIVKNGGKVTDGQNLGIKGYDKVKLVGNVIIGAAWKEIRTNSPAADWF